MRMTKQLKHDYFIWLKQGIEMEYRRCVFTIDEIAWVVKQGDKLLERLCALPPHVREGFTTKTIAEKIKSWYQRDIWLEKRKEKTNV